MHEGGGSKRSRPVGSPSLNPSGRKVQTREDGGQPQSAEGRIAKAKEKLAEAVKEWRDARSGSSSDGLQDIAAE
eukprot:8278391-Karenia_brevis.AAC.1